MFQQIRLPEILIIAAIVLLLFGAKRMPDAARGLGRSLRIFKAETKGLMDDDATKPATPPVGAPTPAPPAVDASTPAPSAVNEAQPQERADS